MDSTGKREKKFTYATILLYFLGWFLGTEYIVPALLSFCGSAICALGTVPLESETKKEHQKQIYLSIAAFILPALGVLLFSSKDANDENKFRNYLLEHRCKEIGSTITGFSKGGCDRFNNCVEPQEIEEAEYFCAVTKKRITFSDFKLGHYGK